MASGRQLVSGYVRAFVEKEGGRIRFRARHDEKGRLFWEVVGVFPDGTEKDVTSSHTGRRKVLRSADAVVGYWLSLFPGEGYLQIPVLPEAGTGIRVAEL